jgi:hypothetical protein
MLGWHKIFDNSKIYLYIIVLACIAGAKAKASVSVKQLVSV